MISDQRDAVCYFCGRLVWDIGWELHELGPDWWEVICQPCIDVTEVDQGK